MYLYTQTRVCVDMSCFAISDIYYMYIYINTYTYNLICVYILYCMNIQLYI